MRIFFNQAIIFVHTPFICTKQSLLKSLLCAFYNTKYFKLSTKNNNKDEALFKQFSFHFFSFILNFIKNITGEKPAAMQHPDKTTAATSSSSTLSSVHYILLPTIPTTLVTATSNNNNTNRNNTSIASFQFFIFNIMTGLLAVRNVLFKKLFYLYC